MSDGSRPLTRREAREREERASRGAGAFALEPTRSPQVPQQSWSLEAAAPPAPAYAPTFGAPSAYASAPAPAPALSLAPAPAMAPAQGVRAPAPAPAPAALTPLQAPAPQLPPRPDIISLAAFPVDTRPTPAPKRPELEHPSRRASRTTSARSRPPKPSAHRSPQRRLARTMLSGIALLFAGAIAIGTSLPVNAFMNQGDLAAAAAATTASGKSGGVADAIPAQSLAVAGDAAMPTTMRDTFTVMSYQQQLRLRYGLTNAGPMFTPTTGAIRWPFPYAVPISDGWGYRDAPCSGCSSMHKGVDFTPGGGAPIYAIADGVVTLHDDTYYGLGNNVTIEHLINGQKVESIYAHMLTGSSPLVVGQVVKVGDFIGLVGDTGSSTGSHLHFEIHLSGEPVDPYAWLTANAVN